MRSRSQPFDPRQQMRRQGYEVFHYQDAKMDSVEVHHHDFYEVYLFLSGNVDYTIEGSLYHLEPGDLLLINPLELHQLKVNASQTSYERFVLWLTPSYLNSLSRPEVSLTVCFDHSRPGRRNLLRPGKSRVLQLIMAELLQEFYSSEYGHEAAADAILLRFLVELNRLALASPPVAVESEDRSTVLIRQVLAYINEHCHQELSLDQIASAFFISKYHLSHEFQRLVGASVYRYIIQKRLIIAKQLLSSGLPPTGVYQNCGFRDYANFYRAFKAEYGISPSEFSAQARERG